MRLFWILGVTLLWSACLNICCKCQANALEIPRDVLAHINMEQLPTITDHSPASLIAFPFEESFPVKCEATGNPAPEFTWTKNGQNFDPYQDSRLLTSEESGTFVVPNNGNLTEFQGIYRCFATNKLGTAMSEETEFIVPSIPKFPKEIIDPIEVIEGQSVILECDPPRGIPPLQIYWMTIGLQHIEQDERVTVGLNGNLYFSNAVETDSRRDYCCFAAFPRIRTIVQKTAMSVVVKSNKFMKDSDSGASRGYANSLWERKPSLLTPRGTNSDTFLVNGEDLQLECIAEGFPTPRVEWTKIGHKLPERAMVESHGKLLTIETVTKEDEGKYMCVAKNLYGEAQHYFHVTVEEPPEWEIEPQSEVVTIGADVSIKCVVKGSPKPSVTWRVNGRPLGEVPASNRKVLKDGSISIHNAKPDNSAVYQCQAKNRHGSVLANANIMVMNIQPVVLTENNLQYISAEGRGVFMHCKVFSSPASSITWSKADSANAVEGQRFFVHANGSLEIHEVMKEDMGEYSCFAQNTEGKAAIAATLEVKDPTRIIIPPQDLRVLVGTTIQFSCQAEFDPSFGNDFEILWEKDGVLLNSTDNSRYVILDDGVLEIINVSFGDQGFFVCVAKTPADQITAVAQLSVVAAPDPPEDVTLSEHNGRSVKLQWIPGDDHNSSITAFIIEFEETQHEPGRWKEMMKVPGNHHSALLKLPGHVDYCFRVSAINEVGRGRASQATERYKTPAAAPDKNPENIKIEGRLPHEMDINWEPLSPIEHNGPGLEYKVSYRRQDSGEDWQEHVVKRHSFLVKNTPTFVPYEIKIQAKNHAGWGPDPKIITAYSGEDLPSAAPEDVAVEVMNNSVVRVRWGHVHKDKVHGHLGGYRVSWWRLRSLLDSRKAHGEKQSLTLSAEKNHGVVSGLRPFSEYNLIVMAFNSRGNGPGSHPVSFKTPEGVPGPAAAFRTTNIQKHKVTLTWSPPFEANGVLTGYVLQYQLMNDTEELGPLMTLNISASSNKLDLQDLEALSKYKFYLRCCTGAGCGPAASEERSTVPEASLASIHGNISNQGWFIGLMCAVALLTLIVLIACFVNRNKGGKYSVKEKEDLHPDLESQGPNDDTFCEYSDNDEKPLKGSQHSLNGNVKSGDSGDSMADYGDEDAHFNEDGSFIGEYSGHKEKVSVEIKGTNQSTA